MKCCGAVLEALVQTLHVHRGHEVERKCPQGALPTGMAMGLMLFSLHPHAQLHLGQPCTHMGSERGPTAKSGSLAQGL